MRRTTGPVIVALSEAVTAGLAWMFRTADMSGVWTTDYAVAAAIRPVSTALAVVVDSSTRRGHSAA
jgi:hypothetical protein